jgi:histidine triad (HIT) family protein
MEDCLFCKIVKGENPSFKVFDNEKVFAFLDIFPSTKGHALVIPKKHAENIFDIDEEDLKEIILAGQKIAKKMRQNLGAIGVKLVNSSGKEAGQVIPHFHLHVLPTYEMGDDKKTHAPGPKADFEELKKLAEKIK